MFIILVYDINKKRVAKIHNICRKYIYPVQRSVFEGEITQKQLKKLMEELERNMNKREDAISVYEMDSSKYAYKVQIGMVEDYSNIL